MQLHSEVLGIGSLTYKFGEGEHSLAPNTFLSLLVYTAWR